jgi:hypothetical protein
MHVHVRSGDGEAKFWLEPDLELAKNYGYTPVQLHRIRSILEAHRDEPTAAWTRHFRHRGN